MNNKISIAVGSDPNAAEMKNLIITFLQDLGYQTTDFGSEDPVYANVAFQVGEAVVKGDFQRGILFCGTGIGMSIAANKVQGVYAALISDPYSAERARKSNNTNVITLGAFTLGIETAKILIRIWLDSEYTPGGRSEEKIRKIFEYEFAHTRNFHS